MKAEPALEIEPRPALMTSSDGNSLVTQAGFLAFEYVL